MRAALKWLKWLKWLQWLRDLRQARAWMLAGAAVLLGVAALLPPLPLTRSVVNHLVVFDITQSMYVADQLQDGRSVSRLAAARNAVIQALQRLPCGSQVGISIFASRRTLLLLAPVEVCANRVELAQAIGQVDARMAWEDASVIVRGIYSATDVAFELPQHPSVVFLTDGQESPPMASIPEFDRPAGRVQGLVVGVGGDIPQPIPHLDKQGRQRGWWSAAEVVQRPTPTGFGVDQEHLSALHEEHLRGVAAAAGLRYARLQDTNGLLDLLTDPRLTRALVVATDLRWLPGGAALLLLALYFLPAPLRWWQRLQQWLQQRLQQRLPESLRQRRSRPAAKPRRPHS